MPNPFTFGGLLPHMPDSLTTAPKMQTFRPLGQDSPLGGMNDGSLQMRGGPMSYNERGVGTNNPNAFRVGGPRLPTGMRLLDRAARHRDPRAISQLAGMEQQQMLQNQGQQFSADQNETQMRYHLGRDQQQQTNFETGRLDSKTMEAERYKQQMERDRLNFEQSQAAWTAQHAVQTADRNTEYQRTRSDMMTDEQRQAERARTANIIIDPITKQPMAGHLITGNGQMIRREAPPISAEDIAMAQANGASVTVPLPGGGQASYGGARPQSSMPRIITGRPDPVTKTPGRDYYHEIDPATGRPRKVYVDEPGNAAAGGSGDGWKGWAEQ